MHCLVGIATAIKQHKNMSSQHFVLLVPVRETVYHKTFGMLRCCYTVNKCPAVARATLLNSNNKNVDVRFGGKL